MTEDTPGYAGTGLYSGFIFLVVVAGSLIVLAAQNTDSVTIQWLGFHFTAPLVAVLLGTMLLAVVLDEAIGWVWRRRRRRILAERKELDMRRALVGTVTGPDVPPTEEGTVK